VANRLAYYDTAKITMIKSFIVQPPGGCTIKILQYCNVQILLSVTAFYNIGCKHTSYDKRTSLVQNPYITEL
jgi:hypothetical protein